MMNLLKPDTRNTLFKGEDLTRFITKLSQSGFARNVTKVNEKYQDFWKTLPNARKSVDVTGKWSSADDELEKKWTALALYANEMYNLTLEFRDLVDKNEDAVKKEGGGARKMDALKEVTKAIVDIHFCIVMEFQFCHDKLNNNRPRPAKELADVLKNHFSISHLRGIATIVTLEQFTNLQQWFLSTFSQLQGVNEYMKKAEKTTLFKGLSGNLKISQIAYFYTFSVYIKDLLNENAFPSNCRGLFEDLRICFQIVSTLLDKNRRMRKLATKDKGDFTVRLGKKMEQMKSKMNSAKVAEELPSVKHQNYIAHCGLKKSLEMKVGDGKGSEMRGALILIDNGVIIINMGSDMYKGNFESFMKELDPDKSQGSVPSNKSEAYYFVPFPFHVKAKGNNSLVITDICGVRASFSKRSQGPITVVFPEENKDQRTRIVGDESESSRDQWMGWVQASILLRAREVTKVCAFMPYRGDFKTNMTARLDLSNSQIEFVTNKWIEDCSQIFGIKRRGAFLYPGYSSEHVRDTFDPQNTDFQRRKWFHEDFETWILMFEDLNKLEVDGTLEPMNHFLLD